MKYYVMNIVGTFCMSLGISLLIVLNLGVDTISMIYLGVQNHVAFEIWQLCMMLNIIVIIVVFFIDRSQIGIGTILNFVGLTFFLKILPPMLMPVVEQMNHWMMYMTMMIGVLSLASGCGIYAKADLGSAAFEALSGALSNKFSFKLSYIRMLLDFIAVAIGMSLGASVGIGTLLCVLCIGPISQKVISLLSKI